MYFSLADLITDITQNSAEAGASLIELTVAETVDSSGAGELRFTVKDNGKGMTNDELKLAQDPFVTDGIKHPNRKVGLGLPFLIQTAGQSGGGWKIKSGKRAAAQDTELPFTTTVSAWFDLGNVDTPPTGDIPGMFRTVLLFNGPAETVLRRKREAPQGQFDYEIRKTELADVLGGLEDAHSLILLDKYLRSLEQQ